MIELPSSPKICVAGAEAIGSALSARLSSMGHTANVLARGETVQAIVNRGVRLDYAEDSLQQRVYANDKPNLGTRTFSSYVLSLTAQRRLLRRSSQ
jgi:ketopantoate reductase